MANKSFDVSREGKELRLRMSAQDLTVSKIARAFQVEERSLYLKEEFGSMTFWPNEAGRFNIMQLEDDASLQVMGESTSVVQSTSGLGQSAASSSALQNQSQVFSYSGAGNAGIFKSPLFEKKKNLAIVKVVHAELRKTEKGAISFHDLNQAYININEESANVTCVRSKAREAFSDRRLELVTSNGLSINDNEGTRGLSFWKCGSRKIYAVVVPADHYDMRVNPKRSAAKSKSDFKYCDISDDSEDEDFVPKKQRSVKSEDFQNVRAEIGHVKCMVSEILEVNKALPMPIGIVKLIKDAFKCKICHETPMQPPIIATKCCNSLLGCESCVNKWYDGVNGLSKKCPHCNEARGYAFSFQFKGIDDFLSGVKSLLRREQERSEDSE